MFELTARTPAGARLIELAEAVTPDLAERAAEHDRDATFPHESIAALKRVGYFRAPIPVELGGLGVDSAHDVIVASSRLARGDASVAIGVNMHLIILFNLVRRWQAACAAGRDRSAQAYAATLRAVAEDGVVIAAAISEIGQDMTRPQTVARRTGSGWRVDGRKSFCSLSPAATVLYTAVTFAGEDGGERYGYAEIPPDAPGVTVHGDWDALGMRASGSHSITFDAVDLPERALRGGFAIGDGPAFMARNVLSGLFHASASLGIAESAVAISRPARDPDARARNLLAENLVDLGAARATLSRAAILADAGAWEEPEVFAGAQAAKAFVNETSARIVDRALALSGGAGYRNGHPLARHYRDVRAGGFMHPLGANRAYDLLADVALGREPALR